MFYFNKITSYKQPNKTLLKTHNSHNEVVRIIKFILQHKFKSKINNFFKRKSKSYYKELTYTHAKCVYT